VDKLDKFGSGEDVPLYSDVECELSMKLFAILAAHLKWRSASLVRSPAKGKDRFRLWRI
jgi:hypothetical protein